jgi:glutamate--cysteine ligase catalytic subunit
MGLLIKGSPIRFENSLDFLSYIRKHGVAQFLNIWKVVKDHQNDDLRWGDEVECGIFCLSIDEDGKKAVSLSLRGDKIIEELREKENNVKGRSRDLCNWVPEYGLWMVESTPGKPYTNLSSDLLNVERNMRLRRRRLLGTLQENEVAPTITCYPLLGESHLLLEARSAHLEGPDAVNSVVPFSHSEMLPDRVISKHPRFGALTRSIRKRRGEKVDIRIPVFEDKKTSPQEVMDGIKMDCMAFGMGMCCLQVTFQARDIEESRYMYDQLGILAPIMLAITASTPIFRGRLASVDARWSAIAQSVDDRTPRERGLLPPGGQEGELDESKLAGGGARRLHKSRYDSISTYLYHCEGHPCQKKMSLLNDVPCPVDETAKETLLAAGLDENLSHHIAHLFVRDPLVTFEGHIELNDEESTDHFETIQSTNWQSVRWKPPPPRLSETDAHIGWRAELRTMEVQFTDFENAAFVVFTVLLTRVVLSLDLSLYIPLSKVDENMKRAHAVDAVKTQKFFFRSVMVDAESAPSPCGSRSPNYPEDYQFQEMSLDEVFNGTKDADTTGEKETFPGLIPLIYAYLDYINCDEDTLSRIESYLQLISLRASGDLLTPATWIRRFVATHPAYQNDSVVSEEIVHDLLSAINEIGIGKRVCSELLGDVRVEPIRAQGAYGSVLEAPRTQDEKMKLVDKLMQRAAVMKDRGVFRGSRAMSDSR